MEENRWGPDAQIPPSSFEAFVLRHLYSDDHNLLAAGLWLLGSALLALPLAFGAAYLQAQNLHLTSRGGVATAQVTGVSYQAPHPSYRVRFTTGPAGQRATISRFHSEPAPGEVIRVRYDRKDPRVAIGPGVSSWASSDASVVTVVALVFLGLMIAYAQRFSRRLRQACRAHRTRAAPA